MSMGWVYRSIAMSSMWHLCNRTMIKALRAWCYGLLLAFCACGELEQQQADYGKVRAELMQHDQNYPRRS